MYQGVYKFKIRLAMFFIVKKNTGLWTGFSTASFRHVKKMDKLFSLLSQLQYSKD